MPGSGKGELSEVASELGIMVVSLGDVVRQHFISQHPDGTGDLIGAFAASEREVYGRDIWAKRLLLTLGPLVDTGRSLLIVDGLRSNYEADLLRRELGGGFLVLAVHSSPTVRFNRLMRRGRSDSPRSIQEFNERERRELSWGMGDVISTADIMLVNEGDLDEFKGLVRSTLSRLGGRI